MCDPAGRILEASQARSSLKAFGLDPAPAGVAVAEIEGLRQLLHDIGTEFVRVTFEYDDHGRLARRATSLAGQHVEATAFAYNALGDLLCSTRESETAVAYEYTYDARSNWVRRLTRHALGVDEDSREIEYFAE